MPKIKVTCGTVGIVLKDSDGNSRFTTRTSSDEAFDVSSEEARRFIDRGVAELVSGSLESAEEPAEAKEVPRLDVEELSAMPNSELKKIAENMGIDTKNFRKKDDFIKAITDVIAEAEESDEEDDLPDLSAADPE